VVVHVLKEEISESEMAGRGKRAEKKGGADDNDMLRP
jgi:hypothetical protein